MPSALLIRLRPSGPWRSGPGEGARDRVDSLYRSDRLYSAVCHAFDRLGLLEEWLKASAGSGQPAAVLSSLFPFQGDTLFAPPPETVWPPASSSLRSPSPVFLTRVRWKAAKFVPLAVIEALLTGAQVHADQWIADADSGCLLRRDRPQSSPFRLALRSHAAVDRVSGASYESHKLACVEFEPGAGLWGVVVFAGAEAAARWRAPLESAFRLLGDSGFGGHRSSGWGQAPDPEIVFGDWPALLLPRLARLSASNGHLSPLHWLLSLYSPGASDDVNWTEGKYSLLLRGGRVESHAGSGALKKPARMVSEGSVLSANRIFGRAVNVAPDDFPHPVYRAGFALALQLPVIQVIEAPAPASEEEPSEKSEILAEALASAEAEAARLVTEALAVTPGQHVESEAVAETHDVESQSVEPGAEHPASDVIAGESAAVPEGLAGNEIARPTDSESGGTDERAEGSAPSVTAPSGNSEAKPSGDEEGEHEV
jgi:CRISPR type III-A-associated RAMP protein Csm4